MSLVLMEAEPIKVDFVGSAWPTEYDGQKMIARVQEGRSPNGVPVMIRRDYLNSNPLSVSGEHIYLFPSDEYFKERERLLFAQLEHDLNVRLAMLRARDY